MKKIIFLHGWTNRRPEGSWHRLAATELRNKGHQIWYPQFPSPDTPKTEEWQELLAQESAMMDEAWGDEKIAIAHSLGCLNWLVAAMTERITPFDRVLFVAPPDTQLTDNAEGIEGDPVDLTHHQPINRQWTHPLIFSDWQSPRSALAGSFQELAAYRLSEKHPVG